MLHAAKRLPLIFALSQVWGSPYISCPLGSGSPTSSLKNVRNCGDVLLGPSPEEPGFHLLNNFPKLVLKGIYHTGHNFQFFPGGLSK